MDEQDKRTYITYQPRDFLLYLVSLGWVFGGAWLAFPFASVRIAFAIVLAYMAVIFIVKRGIALDVDTIVVVARGLAGYPVRLARKIWALRRVRVMRLVVFCIALGIELVLERTLAPDSVWIRPFPYLACFAIVFGLVTAFRTVILVAHLARASLVRATLDDSNWHRELKGLGTTTHIVHAYITGLVCHACALMPALVFWRFTHPTVVRELVLFAFLVYALARGVQRTLRALAIPPSPRNSLVALMRVSLGLTPEVVDALYVTHEEDHKSRFNFVVFHGHHHDAIPSALMAAIDTGFVEAIDRSIWLGTFLNSAIGGLVINAHQSWFDMVLHQYIPGVYPYSALIVTTQAHHVAHHYGSLRPLGLGGLVSYKADLESGYEPNNAKVRWYLDAVRKVEQFDDSVYDQFANLDLAARLKDLAYRGFETPPRATARR